MSRWKVNSRHRFGVLGARAFHNPPPPGEKEGASVGHRGRWVGDLSWMTPPRSTHEEGRSLDWGKKSWRAGEQLTGLDPIPLSRVPLAFRKALHTARARSNPASVRSTSSGPWCCGQWFSGERSQTLRFRDKRKRFDNQNSYRSPGMLATARVWEETIQ